MLRSRLFRWAAVLALVIAPAGADVTSEEPGTITITGTFRAVYMLGPEGTTLADVYANGAEHPWSLTLYGVTHSHSRGTHWGSTHVLATSFDLQFSGPEADVLNAVIADQLGSTGAELHLENHYFDSGDYSLWWLSLPSAGASFAAYHEGYESFAAPFPVDADGCPVLPSQLLTANTDISDAQNTLISYFDTLDVTGDLGPQPPPPPPVPATLSIGDGSVVEGNRGSAKLHLSVRLSSASNQAITVDYRTADGTATSVGGKNSKGDYTAASGTLTFQPGETGKTITISIKADRTVEADETFAVELFNVVGTTIVDGVALVTIRNDD